MKLEGKARLIKQGFDKWVFVGTCELRAPLVACPFGADIHGELRDYYPRKSSGNHIVDIEHMFIMEIAGTKKNGKKWGVKKDAGLFLGRRLKHGVSNL